MNGAGRSPCFCEMGVVSVTCQVSSDREYRGKREREREKEREEEREEERERERCWRKAGER